MRVKEHAALTHSTHRQINRTHPLAGVVIHAASASRTKQRKLLRKKIAAVSDKEQHGRRASTHENMRVRVALVVTADRQRSPVNGQTPPAAKVAATFAPTVVSTCSSQRNGETR
jgi:hypothetical protein